MPDYPDIFLITVDALRADHLSCYGHRRETTFFELFADRSMCFEKAFSVSSHTREAMPPILSGYHPERFPSNGFRQVPESESLAGKLAAEGYATGGFHSNPYLSRAYGFDAGFDAFDDDLLLGQNKFLALVQQALDRFIFNRGEYYARAPEINRRSLAWLDDTDGPVFLWNHYMDPHGPYHAPEQHYVDQTLSASAAESLYRRAWEQPSSITDAEQQLLRDSYDDEIRYLNAQLQSFFEELKSRNRLADALVIVTSDHGDGFGEHGYYAHPRYLHDILIHVPLLVSSPTERSQAVEIPVSTLDIVPTILETVNVDHDLPGASLLEHGSGKSQHQCPERERVVFASAIGENGNEDTRRYTARAHRWKAMLERNINSGAVLDERVYDLQADPQEQEALDPIQANEDLMEQLRVFSASRLSSVDEGAEAEPLQDLPDEINERLEALGYK